MKAEAKALSGRDARRMRVLGEAAKTLNRRGVSQTSLAEIAQRLDVSRAALYYYFDDQQDLVFQCYRFTFEQMAARLSLANHSMPSAVQKISAFVESMLSDDGNELASPSEAFFLEEEQRRTIVGLYEGVRASLAETIQAGIDAGELRPCRPRIVAAAIMGVIHWAPALRRWRVTSGLSLEELTGAMLSLLKLGVAARRSDPAAYTPLTLTAPGLPVGRIFDHDAMSAARQEALLAAASWLFNLKGVDATSLEQVALRVGVTKKVIYHNMGDKQTLVAACHRRSHSLYIGIVDQMRDYSGLTIDALCAGAHAFAEASMREDIATFAPLTGHDSWPEEAREDLQKTAEQLMDRHLQVFQKGWADGSVRDLNARAVLSMVAGLFEWCPRWIDAFTPAEVDVVPRELTELYRIGICAI